MAAEQKLPKLSKRVKAVRAKVDRSKAYPVDEALKLVKETAAAKFDESVDIAVNLGVDPKKSDQTVRGSVVLPAGTSKKVRVAVFAQGDKAKAAKDAGADIVGFDDLAAKIKEGFMDFDVVIASLRERRSRKIRRLEHGRHCSVLLAELTGEVQQRRNVRLALTA